jgi:hypothetical protein
MTDTWRLRVLGTWKSGGRSPGGGFVVSPGLGVTCAHVAGDAGSCDLRSVGQSWTTTATTTWVDPSFDARTNPLTDVALVHLPRHGEGSELPVAPLGSTVSPAPGTELEVLGFHRWDDTIGVRASMSVAGPDGSGRWLQVVATSGHGSRIVSGFSGSPAVHAQTGRVMGMIVQSSQIPDERVSWLIPMSTLVASFNESSGPGRAAVRPPSAFEADADFANGKRQLAGRDYEAASTAFIRLASVYPAEPDIYYYRALAGLRGRTPGSLSPESLAAVEGLLRAALELDSRSIHAAALWALVKEDFFQQRGASEGIPTIAQLSRHIPSIDPRHSQEITDHVPARRCRVWQTLSDRSLT